MDFEFSEEQELLRETARDFLTQLAPAKAVRAVMEGPETHDRELWVRMAELGWMGLAVPDQYGGSGLGPIELGIVLEELGCALAPVAFLPTQIAARAILEAGNSAQHKHWLTPIACGDQIATFATAEQRGGDELAEIQLAASQTPDGWQLDGRKWFVPDAQIADLIVVAARTGAGDIGLFAIPRATTGIRVVPMQSMDPLRTLYVVEFDAVSVPRDAHLAGSPDPVAALRSALDHALVMIAAEMLGGAQRCLDDAVAHAQQREQFGKPIGAYQAIKHKCADMLFEVESARSITYYASWSLGAGNEDASLAAAMAKSFVSDAYRDVSGKNIQIHGGVGFTWEYDCHLLFKRAKSDEAWLGDGRYHRERIAQLLEI